MIEHSPATAVKPCWANGNPWGLSVRLLYTTNGRNTNTSALCNMYETLCMFSDIHAVTHDVICLPLPFGKLHHLQHSGVKKSSGLLLLLQLCIYLTLHLPREGGVFSFELLCLMNEAKCVHCVSVLMNVTTFCNKMCLELWDKENGVLWNLFMV